MTGDVRPVGLGFGLVLGLVLAAPWLSPALLPWGVQALFLLSAFLVRLADRRWHRRKGAGGWLSHIRMMPTRLLPWAAVAVVAIIADTQEVSALSIFSAAAISEYFVYPLLSGVIGKIRRAMMIIAMIGLWALLPSMGSQAAHYIGMFAIGTLLCACWLRGADGDPRALALALVGTFAFAITGWAMPAVIGWSMSAATICATLALAHLSTLRPPVAHWRPQGQSGIRRRWTRAARSLS